jgi:hypothetical protein
MVMAGTQIPHGYGMFIDMLYQDWHIGHFEYGVPSGFGIQVVFETEQWLSGMWIDGFLDEVTDYGGKADPGHLYGLTAWPGILPKPAVVQTAPSNNQTQPAGQSGLLVVSHPPAQFHDCEGCGGTGRTACTSCGTPSANASLNPDGTFSMGLFLMNSTCFTCFGNGSIACRRVCGDGKSWQINAAYVAYVENLMLLSAATGINVFEIAPGYEKKYISVQLCVHCNGNVASGQRLCMSCVYGYHVNFPGDPSDRFVAPASNFTMVGYNANEGMIAFYRDRIAVNAANRDNSPWHTSADNGRCLSCGASGYPTCTSCRTGRNAIDLGAQTMGNCVRCGGRAYTASPYCGACR